MGTYLLTVDASSECCEHNSPINLQILTVVILGDKMGTTLASFLFVVFVTFCILLLLLCHVLFNVRVLYIGNIALSITLSVRNHIA